MMILNDQQLVFVS